MPALMDDIAKPVGPEGVQMVGATIFCVQADGSLTEIVTGAENSYQYDPSKQAIVDSYDGFQWEPTEITPDEIIGR